VVLAEGLGISAESRERGLAAAHAAIASWLAGSSVNDRERERAS
jgi:hypothetical protein